MNEDKERTEGICTWSNRGLKSKPYWFIVGCTGRNVNVAKLMRRQRHFIDVCPYCGQIVEWEKSK